MLCPTFLCPRKIPYRRDKAALREVSDDSTTYSLRVESDEMFVEAALTVCAVAAAWGLFRSSNSEPKHGVYTQDGK